MQPSLCCSGEEWTSFEIGSGVLEEDVWLACLTAVGALVICGVMNMRTLVCGVRDVRAYATLIFFVLALSGEMVQAGAGSAYFDWAVITGPNPSASNGELCFLMDGVAEFRGPCRYALRFLHFRMMTSCLSSLMA